jgi:hypothetical protein
MLRRTSLDITTKAATGSISSCAALNWSIFCWRQHSHSRASLPPDPNIWSKSFCSLEDYYTYFKGVRQVYYADVSSQKSRAFDQISHSAVHHD